jgi:hypothetical protein
MSEYDDGSGYGDAEQVQAEFTDGSSLTLVDVNGDGVADVAAYDVDGDGHPDGYAGEYPSTPNGESTESAPYESAEYEPAPYESGEYESAPYGENYESYEPGYAETGSMYTNDYIGTAVSSNPGGEEFYINLGDGQFY